MQTKDNTTPKWLRVRADGVSISCAIQASAKKTEVVGEHGDHLKLKIAAPRVDGAANEAICEFLAKEFSIKKRDVVIEHGGFGKTKVIFLAGVTAERVHEVFGFAGAVQLFF